MIAIGLGFILGGIRRQPAFFVEIEDEEEPRISEEVHVVDRDFTILRKGASIQVKSGSLFIPVVTGREIGGIYFGAGSYHVDAKIKEYSDV